MPVPFDPTDSTIYPQPAAFTTIRSVDFGTIWSEIVAAIDAKADIAGDTFTGTVTADVAFTQTGTGASARTVDAKLKDYWKTPEDFGCVGDGSTTDTTNFQEAIDAVNAAGGGILYCPKKYKLGNITVKSKVHILGGFTFGEFVSFQDYYALPSQIRLTSGTTITMQAGSSCSGMVVIRDGLTLISSLLASTALNNAACVALLNQFGGTAFTASNTTQIALRDLLVLGHARVCDVSDSTQVRPGRFTAHNVRFDCTNGISVQDAADICRFTDCHGWPYLTVDVCSTASPYASPVYLTRPGTAFYFGTNGGAAAQDDSSVVSNCFAYGYNYSFACDDSSETSIIACRSDRINKNDASSMSTVTGATWTTGVATLTHTSGITYPIGCNITVRNMTPSGFNGTVVVTAATTTTVSYAVVADPGAFVSAGAGNNIQVLGQIAYYFTGSECNTPTLSHSWAVGHEYAAYINITQATPADVFRLIGNNLTTPNGTGVKLIDGYLLASGNTLSACATGFDIGAGSTGGRLSGNTITNCSAGYTIASGVKSATYIDGFSADTGGTQTQATDKSTGVALNGRTGQITLNNANLNAATTVSFTLTNSAIAAGDVLALNHISGGTAGAYTLNAQTGSGTATINVRNITAGNLGEAIVIAFVVHKAAVP